MRIKNKTLTRSFSITTQTLDKMDEIKRTLGLTSVSGILALAINSFHTIVMREIRDKEKSKNVMNE